MESKLNTSNTPLNTGGLFIGAYESVVEFSSIVLSIYSDTETTISCYQSLNKQLANVSVFTGVASVQSTFIISPIILPYVYFTVRNSSGSNQTVLNFSVAYKNSAFATAGTGADVNITNAFLPVSQYGAWNVNTQLLKSSSSIWDNAVVGAGDVSANYANANAINNQSISVFGHSSNPTIISILVSNNNINYYYTQYTYNIPEDSDFGFALVLPFKYLKLASSEATTISASVCWC
jgi:hypothetical protein